MATVAGWSRSLAASTSPSPTPASPSRGWRRRGISTEEWERVFEVDLLGVWRTARAALPQIVERRGQIVLISSVYAFMNGMVNSPYAVAKAGVESTRAGPCASRVWRHATCATSALRFGRVDANSSGAFAQPDASRVKEAAPPISS